MVKKITQSTKIISVTLLVLLSSSMYAGGHSRSRNNRKWSIKKYIYFFKAPVNINSHSSSGSGTPSIPLDGELGLLLLGGAVFGIKKLRDNKSKNNSVQK